MAEQAQKVMTQGERLKARLERLRQNQTRPGIRVEPRDDAMRRLLVHPTAGRFSESGSREWPDDRFTRRRIADGSVTVVEERSQQRRPGAAPRPQHQAPAAHQPRSE